MEKKELLGFIKKAQKRIFLVNLLELLFWSLMAGLGIGILINGISLFVPLYGAERAALAVVALFGLIALVFSAVRFPGKEKTAAALDRKGLKERVSTALEQLTEEGVIQSLQRQDTLKHLRSFSLKEAFPLKKSMARGLWLLGLSGIFLMTALLPSKARTEALLRHELKEEAKVEAQKAEELKKLIDTEQGLKELLKADASMELKRQIDESIRELSQASDKKELLKAEKRLAKKVSQALEGAAGLQLGSRAEAMLSDYIPELRKERQELAQNMQMNGQNENNTMSGSSQNGQSSEAQKGGSQSGDGQSSENQSGEGQSGDGQNGTGQIGNNQTGSSQNGSGQNGTGSTGNGANGSGKGSGYNYGSSQGMEKTDKTNRGEPEQITIAGRTAGKDENLSGEGKNGSSAYQKGSQSEGFRGEVVDYGAVLGEYSQAAYDKLESGKIPAGMEAIVKNYFDGLNE